MSECRCPLQFAFPIVSGMSHCSSVGSRAENGGLWFLTAVSPHQEDGGGGHFPLPIGM